MNPVYVSKLLCLVAVIIFVLTCFGVTVGDGTSAVEMVSAGLAFLAASFLVP